MAIADFDGDGRADLALGYHQPRTEGKSWTSGSTCSSAGKAAAGSRRCWRSTGSDGPWSLATGDLDGDGHTDLVAATGNGEVWVFLGDGTGKFSRESGDGLVPPGGGCTGFHVALADLDGVPGDEVVVAFAGEPGSESDLRS